jgi:hypothetical protein
MTTQKDRSAVSCILNEVQILCKSLGVDRVKRGPKPHYPDSFIISLLIIKNLLSINSETALLRHLASNYGDIFERLPEQSWFNRKARKLGVLCDSIAEQLLDRMDLGSVQIPDSTPVPVCKRYRGYNSPIFPRGEQYNYGYCASKKEYYYGVKWTLVTNEFGVPVTYGVCRANKHDLKALEEMLPRMNTAGITMIADRGYYDGELRAMLSAHGSNLVVPDKARHHVFNTVYDKRLLKKRSIVETVIEQLKSTMKIHEHLAQSYEGLMVRIASAIMSFVFAVYHNIQNKRPLLSVKSILM